MRAHKGSARAHGYTTVATELARVSAWRLRKQHSSAEPVEMLTAAIAAVKTLVDMLGGQRRKDGATNGTPLDTLLAGATHRLRCAWAKAKLAAWKITCTVAVNKKATSAAAAQRKEAKDLYRE